MKVEFIGTPNERVFTPGKAYEVISIERGWYRIMTELEEDYLFPPESFKIVEP